MRSLGSRSGSSNPHSEVDGPSGRWYRENTMPNGEVVFVVDTDAGMREAMSAALRADGLEVRPYASPHEALAHADEGIPFVLVTGRGDVALAVRAAPANGEPCKEHLVHAVREALAAAGSARQANAQVGILRKRYASLTAREREVMRCIAAGLLNKQAGARLGISEVTVKVHRRHIMQKMRARSLPELVRMTEKLEPQAPALQ